MDQGERKECCPWCMGWEVDGLLISASSQFVFHPVPWKDISPKLKALIDGFWGTQCNRRQEIFNYFAPRERGKEKREKYFGQEQFPELHQ